MQNVTKYLAQWLITFPIKSQFWIKFQFGPKRPILLFPTIFTAHVFFLIPSKIKDAISNRSPVIYQTPFLTIFALILNILKTIYLVWFGHFELPSVSSPRNEALVRLVGEQFQKKLPQLNRSARWRHDTIAGPFVNNRRSFRWNARWIGRDATRYAGRTTTLGFNLQMKRGHLRNILLAGVYVKRNLDFRLSNDFCMIKPT